MGMGHDSSLQKAVGNSQIHSLKQIHITSQNFQGFEGGLAHENDIAVKASSKVVC